MSTTDSHNQGVYEFQYAVRSADSAAMLSIEAGDEFPDVLATSRMVALMELAAARLMRNHLKPGQLSVGVSVDVRHLAATPLFESVSIKAIDLGPEGKLRKFRVEVTDAGGLVGEGWHTRGIVTLEPFLQRAAERVAAGDGHNRRTEP
jgi:predicted thioesterase